MGISGFNKMMQKEFKKSFAQPKTDGGKNYKKKNNNNNRSNSNFTSSLRRRRRCMILKVRINWTLEDWHRSTTCTWM